jgi:O-6-methylguanine DNA methyltransferase
MRINLIHQMKNLNKLTFSEKVFDVVKKIPKGKTLTYKEVAKKAGVLKAYRAVGNILNKNYNSNIHCHRVIRSDGKLGGYNRGLKEKMRILKEEKAI